MIDIVRPKGNEKEFIQMAKELGHEGICFYGSDKKIESDFPIFYTSNIVIKQNPAEKKFNAKGNDIFFDMESTTQRDKLHSMSSGLNHVLAKQCSSKGIIIGFAFSCMLNARKRDNYLARIKQNIRLVRKCKNELAIFSFASKPYEMRSAGDLKSLFMDLGMHASEAKKALESVGKRILRNTRKKKGLYIMEGVEKASTL